LAAGSRHGGFSLYIRNGRLKYAVNDGERGIYTLEAPDPAPLGKSVVKLIFVRTSAVSAQAGLFIDGKAQGRLNIPKALRIFLSGSSTIGANKFSAVTDDYDAPFPFDGELVSLYIHTSASTVNTEEELKKFLAED
jgi:arylsulfatase